MSPHRWLVPGLDLNDRVIVTASGGGYNRVEVQNAPPPAHEGSTLDLNGGTFDIGKLAMPPGHVLGFDHDRLGDRLAPGSRSLPSTMVSPAPLV